MQKSRDTVEKDLDIHIAVRWLDTALLGGGLTPALADSHFCLRQAAGCSKALSSQRTPKDCPAFRESAGPAGVEPNLILPAPVSRS